MKKYNVIPKEKRLIIRVTAEQFVQLKKLSKEKKTTMAKLARYGIFQMVERNTYKDEKVWDF